MIRALSLHSLPVISLVVLGWAGSLRGEGDDPSARKPTAAQLEFFEKEVRPVLVGRCYKCHAAESKKVRGGLRLDTREGVLKGGDSGQAAVAGDPDQSPLIQAVRYDDPELRMPPDRRLPPARWRPSRSGSAWGCPTRGTGRGRSRPGTGRHPGRGAAVVVVPAGPRAGPAAGPRRALAPQRRRPVRPRRAGSEGDDARPRGRPADPDPPRHVRPDRAAADARGGRGVPRRRLPGRLRRPVDRLLASPHYGERWGRHWLDVVRYADTSGCNGDFPVPEAYRYRNYVIDSFNQDKPYDQFLREQIAGDLLPVGLGASSATSRSSPPATWRSAAGSRRSPRSST